MNYFSIILYIYIYTYIYMYISPSTDKLFLCIRHLSVVRHVTCFKQGSKPAQLYVRVSI